MTFLSVYKKHLRLPVLFLAFLFLPRCIEEDSTIPSGAGWTSTDPVSIPLRHRLMQSEKGNLVRNPSFETGRVINLDSSTVSYNIAGWKTMGEQVVWIRRPQDSSSNQVHTGYYAIRIHREKDDPAAREGAGIVSDYVRLIPGNYQLSLWIRLKDIQPFREREGKRLGDAIDLRLLYYDKNRLLISGQTYDPYRKAYVDHSFKATPFINFWEIDSLDWCRVSGMSSHDYLNEGDIPDEAKYLKVFIGLKGTGTVWIDDVDLRYSRMNFTPLERTRTLFDSARAPLELVVPTPRKAEPLGSLVYHVPGTDSIPLPLIILPPGSAIQTRAAANLLKSRLDSIFARRFGKDSLPGIKVVISGGTEVYKQGGLVFRFGKRPHRIPGPEGQGYVLEPDSVFPNLISLSGASPVADYYAASTVVQLLDDSLFVYYSARIEDYPDIPERAFLVSPVAAASNSIDYKPYLSRMACLKLNWAYLDFYRSRTLWLQESPAYLKGLEVLSEENRENGMLKFAQMVNPYAYLPYRPLLDSLGEEQKLRWFHCSPDSRADLLRLLEKGVEAGVSSLVLCSHDYLPRTSEGNYPLYNEKDQKAYINLQEAHLDLLLRLRQWVRVRNPGLGLEFIPPWYSNEEIDLSRGQAEQYFHDLRNKWPEDLLIHWAGPARESYTVNSLDFQRYQELAGRKPVFLDNGLNALPQILKDTSRFGHRAMKLRSLSLFDPLQVPFPVSCVSGEKTDRILINSSLSSEIMKIRMATAADYMWNTEAYDPDLSIFKVLVSRYGSSAAREMYAFNEAYFMALASVVGLKSGMDQARLLKQINEMMIVMDRSLVTLGNTEGFHGGLLNELKSLKLNLESLYDTEIRSMAAQIIASGEGL